MLAVARLQLRQLLSNRKALALALFLAFPAGVSLLLRLSAGGEIDDQAGMSVFLFVLFPQVTSELLALLFASTLIANEMEGQTIVYLFTRPLAKWRVVVAKFAVVAAVLTTAITASLLVSLAILGFPGGPRGALSLVVTSS